MRNICPEILCIQQQEFTDTVISVWCLLTCSSSGLLMTIQQLSSAYTFFSSWTSVQGFGFSRHFNVAPSGFWSITKITTVFQVWLHYYYYYFLFYIKCWIVDIELILNWVRTKLLNTLWVYLNIYKLLITTIHYSNCYNSIQSLY